MQRTWIAIVAALGFAWPIEAQLEPSRGDRLDPFEFAAKVRERGDAPIIDALTETSRMGRSARRRAIRAAPHLRVPAAALRPLASIAASREPFDSFAAMHAAFLIVRALPEDAVERFELDRDALIEAAGELERLAGDEAAPTSLRRTAGVVAIELRDRVSGSTT